MIRQDFYIDEYGWHVRIYYAVTTYWTERIAGDMWRIGCRTIEYFPVETVRTDTVYVNSVSVDSVLVRDSVYIHEKGDTVTEYRYKYVYRFKDRVDTLYISSRDTVSVPYPVEKDLTRWQRTKVDYGGWAMGIVFVFILVVVGYMVYKIRK